MRSPSDTPMDKLKPPRAVKRDSTDTPLNQFWMGSTRLVRYLKQFDDGFKRERRLLDACSNPGTVQTIIQQLAARSQHDRAHEALTTLYQRNPNPKYVGLAYLLLLKFESGDGIFGIVERVQDRIHRCSSAQKQAYTLTVTQGAHLMECRSEPLQFTEWDSLLNNSKILENNTEVASSSTNTIPALRYCIHPTERQALRRIQEIFEDYLETHKENAFMSAFHEPARWYYDVTGNHHHRDHVDVHGLNGWLCLIRGWFGAQIPIIPEASDGDAFKGCSDVWAGMSKSAWDVFKSNKNFGKSYKGMSRQLKSSMVTDKRYGSNFSSGVETGFVGRTAQHMENGAKKKQSKYRPYCEKFAYFFRLEFLVKKLFEVLNAEEKAEHIGFRKCCDVLFPIFCERELRLREVPDFLEFMYDDMLMNLQIGKAARFFWWLGVIKEGYTSPLKVEEEHGLKSHDCGKCGHKASPPGKFCDECGNKIMENWNEEEAFFGEAKGGAVEEEERKVAAKKTTTKTTPLARSSKSPMRPEAPNPKKARRRPSPRTSLELVINKPPTPPKAKEQHAHPNCVVCGAGPMAPFKFCVGCGDNMEHQRAARADTRKKARANWKKAVTVVKAINRFARGGRDLRERKPAAKSRAKIICVAADCGCELSPPFFFCHECGTKQPGGATATATATKVTTPTQRKNSNLNVNKVKVKPKPRPVTPEAALPPPAEEEDPMTCPICMEITTTTILIPHWQSKGDISGHKMCADCSKNYNKNECPFCHEVSIKEEIMVLIRNFIQAMKSSSGDPQRAAALAERWQEKNAWIRDANGLIFRWRSLCKDGKINVGEDTKKDLESGYKLSLSLLKNTGANGHHMGAFYSQALAVWLAAFQGQDDGDTLRNMVKHAGGVVIEMYKKGKRENGKLKKEVRERIVGEYSGIFSAMVWGGEEVDPVWKAFYR
ncbi:hypothetical protein TL16_g03771 [Triparma laevis f. inornata]|uniref:RING-type domain-containing protein n=1 Tax=Triparma laevis f. inornata TaxID=1714386 RepID=A0A9W7A0F6_9STRA|nr:hypothetical protein TL16_g03771 [Triparma laevis f. inornata]